MKKVDSNLKPKLPLRSFRLRHFEAVRIIEGKA